MNRNKIKGCPGRRDFVRLCLGELEGEAKQEFLKHVLLCPACRPRLRVLTNLRSEASSKGSAIPEMGLTNQESAVLREMAAERLKSLGPSARSRRLSFVPFAAAASLLVIALGAGYLFLMNAHSANLAIRGTAPPTLRLLEPGTGPGGPPAAFSWSDVKGRDDFLFFLIDDNLDTIYETGTKETQIRLPETVRLKLKRGVTYLWTVRALDDDGRELGWASREFQVE